MQDLLDFLIEVMKKLYLPLSVAVLGTIIHLYRSKEKPSVGRFSVLTLINVGMVFTTGIICQDYLEMENDRLIWVLSGVACSFSTFILDLIENILTEIAPEAIRKFLNVDKDKEGE